MAQDPRPGGRWIYPRAGGSSVPPPLNSGISNRRLNRHGAGVSMNSLNATFLEQVASAHLPQSRPSEEWQNFQVNWLDLRRMKLNLGAFVPFLTKRSPGTPDDADSTLRGMINYARSLSQSS